jgi:transposase
VSYIGGESREQTLLLPNVLDDYVAENNPVRFIDAFVEGLDLVKLEFAKSTPKDTGRPPYDPADLLRLYIYGYVNQIRSSRKLERETTRNLELMWLMRKLSPDHKTIAEFRRSNVEVIKKVCREFTLLCKQMGLFGGELIAIDGSKFKAVNSKERNYTVKKLEKLISWAEERIEEYMKEMDKGDERENGTNGLTSEELKEKIAELGKRRERYEGMKKALSEGEQTQISLTDPDARLMRTRHGMDVCYNVQVAVDSKHKLIVAHEVTNAMSDRNELSSIAKQAKEELAVEEIEAVTDMGYYDCSEVKECEGNRITVYMEKPPLSEKTKLFTKDDFVYDPDKDVYRCPAGAELTYRTDEKDRHLKHYKTDACASCVLLRQCTTAKGGRTIKRLTDEAVMDRMAERVRGHPEKIGLRKGLVEHPFGTMKRAMNQGYFLMRGKTKVAAEMSLTVLSYNIKRVMNIIGVEKMIEAVGRQ